MCGPAVDFTDPVRQSRLGHHHYMGTRNAVEPAPVRLTWVSVVQSSLLCRFPSEGVNRLGMFVGCMLCLLFCCVGVFRKF